MSGLNSNPSPKGTEGLKQFLDDYASRIGIELNAESILSNVKIKGLIEIIVDIERRVAQLEREKKKELEEIMKELNEEKEKGKVRL